jgi:hypothetical protein
MRYSLISKKAEECEKTKQCAGGKATTFKTPQARLANCGNPFNPEFNTQNGTASQLESMTQASCIRHGAWKGGPALVTPSQNDTCSGIG